MAVSSRIEDAVVDRIASLGLTLGAVAVVVERKKAPKVERGLENSPRIQVAAAERPVRCEWLDTGAGDYPLGRKKNVYPVELSFTSPGDRDPAADADDYRDWREAVARAFEPPSVLGIEEVFDVQVDPDRQYERAGFARNLDQSKIVLNVVTVETAGAV